jgi:hypothetical protein
MAVATWMNGVIMKVKKLLVAAFDHVFFADEDR